MVTDRKIVERFIVPHIGRVRLDRLAPQDVRRLLNACREAVQRGRRDKGRPLSPRTLQMIHAVLRNAIEHAVREAGAEWQDSGLVFTTAHGTPIEPRNLNRHWYGVRDRAALPGVRPHDLRHTCVTLLLEAGVPPHIVQAIAGHSGIDDDDDLCPRRS
jgi:integrase